MLYSCIHMATMGVKGLIKRFDAFVLRVDTWFCWAAIDLLTGGEPAPLRG